MPLVCATNCYETWESIPLSPNFGRQILMNYGLTFSCRFLSKTDSKNEQSIQTVLLKSNFPNMILNSLSESQTGLPCSFSIKPVKWNRALWIWRLPETQVCSYLRCLIPVDAAVCCKAGSCCRVAGLSAHLAPRLACGTLGILCQHNRLCKIWKPNVKKSIIQHNLSTVVAINLFTAKSSARLSYFSIDKSLL